MSFSLKNAIAIPATICLILMLLYTRWLINELGEVKHEKQRAVTALAEERANSAKLRTQYLQIQGVVDAIAENKQQSDKNTEALRKALASAQKGSPCAGVPVPDPVNQQLREQADRINAAAATK
ncbi:hypothetical protein [Budvicia aquatica]|uniref:DUF2570 domain-containing protein n=1 Tax=Budvicia aquatica TaxID=82979 RepID=A0A2C6DLH8_9GAMM|nr:hypothetical protein [Budvicia aquatica]PHI31178.1 hypothetical protein CRN84_18445 [Budvicia aquatica]VFS51438.1 Uncharacterised protein [Budvicia aquatica]